MKRRLKPADSLDSYLARVKEGTHDWEETWFRGQGAAQLLVPGLYRDRRKNLQRERAIAADRVEDALDDEHNWRDQFMLRAGPLLADAAYQFARHPGTAWDWYSVMRHYGLPTRLLDWTESSLVALLFAVCEGPELKTRSGPSVVWALDPFVLNALSSHETIPIDGEPTADMYLTPKPLINGGRELRESIARMPETPIAVQPALNSRRIAVQRGRFTVHGRSPMRIDEFMKKVKTGILRIDIKRPDTVRKQLRTAGFSAASVYPELPHLATEIRDW